MFSSDRFTLPTPAAPKGLDQIPSHLRDPRPIRWYHEHAQFFFTASDLGVEHNGIIVYRTRVWVWWVVWSQQNSRPPGSGLWPLWTTGENIDVVYRWETTYAAIKKNLYINHDEGIFIMQFPNLLKSFFTGC